MQNLAKNIFFSGRVQGVGFRFTAARIAMRYALTGFVRNLPDGKVEMFAQGKADDISDCLRDISETFDSYIRDTKIEEMPLNPRYSSFEIAF